MSKKKLTREDVYKKPPLARLYDRIVPGDYTIKQDFHHTLFLFVFIVVVIALGAAISIGTWNKLQYEKSEWLMIPKQSFVSGQEQTVMNMLEGYDFKNIGYDENGNIVAAGTPIMVQQYKDSYKKKNVDPLYEVIDQDRTNLGVESLSISDDFRTFTITTYGKRNTTSEELAKIVMDDDISKMIRIYSTWCSMRNEGEPLTMKFIDISDTIDGDSGTEYFRTNATSGMQIVSEKEKEENQENQNDNETNVEEST